MAIIASIRVGIVGILCPNQGFDLGSRARIFPTRSHANEAHKVDLLRGVLSVTREGSYQRATVSVASSSRRLQEISWWGAVVREPADPRGVPDPFIARRLVPQIDAGTGGLEVALDAGTITVPAGHHLCSLSLLALEPPAKVAQFLEAIERSRPPRRSRGLEPLFAECALEDQEFLPDDEAAWEYQQGRLRSMSRLKRSELAAIARDVGLPFPPNVTKTKFCTTLAASLQ